MDLLFLGSDRPDDEKKCPREKYVQPGQTDTTVQLAISLLLGFSAFFAFCVRLASFSSARILSRPLLI
jgi:hypothetical protein